jgi:hypothetical protein
MTSKQRKKLEQQLRSRLPLIGGWLSRRAARRLAEDRSPEAARALAEAVTQSSDPQLRSIAIEALRRMDRPAAINAACAVWHVTRDADLTALLVERHWLAAAPATVKVSTALKLSGRADRIGSL